MKRKDVLGLGLSLAIVGSQAFAMGKSPATIQELKNDQNVILSNQDTIDKLDADLGLPIESLPQISQDPTVQELQGIINAQSLRINALTLQLQDARAAGADAEERARNKAVNLGKNPNIDPTQWQESRCRGLGDSITNPMVQGRKTWALQCFGAYADEVLRQSSAYSAAHGGVVKTDLFEKALDLVAEADLIGTDGGKAYGTQGQAFYPTFGTVVNGAAQNPAHLVAPVSFDTNNPCNIAYASSGGDNGPSATVVQKDLFRDLNYELVAMCVSGCYTPDQRLVFKDGYQEIAQAMDSENLQIETLTEDSTLEHPKFQITELQAFTVDIAPSLQTIIDFETLSGKKLSVTPNHALLGADGKMREASSFRVGDCLVQVDGSDDPILKIQERSYFGKVYNVHPKSGKKLENIVVAEGLLSGSVYYQNDGIKDLNRALFRIHLPKNLLQ